MPPVVGHMIAILLILTLVYYCIKNIRSSSCSGDCTSCSDATDSCQKTLPPEEVHRRIQESMDRRREEARRKREEEPSDRIQE